MAQYLELEKVRELISNIVDPGCCSFLTTTPQIFTDSDRFDCGLCPNGRSEDTRDHLICGECWIEAVNGASVKFK